MEMNRVTLQFEVVNQSLSRMDDTVLVSKALNFIYMRFNFSSEWKGLTKYAIVRPLDIDNNYQVPLDKNNIGKVPYNLLDFPGFIVSVVGLDDTNNVRATTTSVVVRVEFNDMDGGSDLPVQNITSNDDTLVVERDGDIVNLGLSFTSEFDKDTSTYFLYATTYNEDGSIRTKKLLTSCIINIEGGGSGEGATFEVDNLEDLLDVDFIRDNFDRLKQVKFLSVKNRSRIYTKILGSSEPKTIFTFKLPSVFATNIVFAMPNLVTGGYNTIKINQTTFEVEING